MVWMFAIFEVNFHMDICIERVICKFWKIDGDLRTWGRSLRIREAPNDFTWMGDTMKCLRWDLQCLKVTSLARRQAVNNSLLIRSPHILHVSLPDWHLFISFWSPFFSASEINFQIAEWYLCQLQNKLYRFELMYCLLRYLSSQDIKSFA